MCIQSTTMWRCGLFYKKLVISPKQNSPNRSGTCPNHGTVITSNSGVDVTLQEVIEVYEKDETAKELIKLSLGKNEFLNNMMDEMRLEAVALAMHPQEYEQDAYVYKEGETGAHMYVSVDGIFDVIKNDIVINSFGAGVVFGELEILYKALRFTSIRARKLVKVWMVHRTVFHRIMAKFCRLEWNENLHFLKSVGVLSGLTNKEYVELANLVKRQFYTAGAQIVKQGAEGDLFFVIRAGTVRILKQFDNGDVKVVNKLKRRDCFGQHALLHRERRLATVVAEPPGTECLTIDREAFDRYLARLEKIQALPVDESECDPPASTYNSQYSHIKFSDLQDIRLLGVGSYGRVRLVEDKNTKKRFALKYLKKYEIAQLNHEKHVYREKDVMTSCDSQFIVKLYNTYRDSKYLYFLMEACLGGDLWTALNTKKYFNGNVARFITACVTEGLGYMHSRNMIYRDLKPENLMIDEKGYIKLVDFGFARRLQPPHQTNTFVGTLEYIAPEIVLGNGHDRAADFWAIGILIHELLTGHPVFRGYSHAQTYCLIVRGIESIILPSQISPVAQDLIKQLCRANPFERLGYADKGIKNIQNHNWFKGFYWEKLRNGTMRAPRELKKVHRIPIEMYPKDDDNPPDETSGWDIYF